MTMLVDTLDLTVSLTTVWSVENPPLIRNCTSESPSVTVSAYIRGEGLGGVVAVIQKELLQCTQMHLNAYEAG